MTLREFVTEFKHTDFKHDPWGECLHAWFECAGRLNRRGIPIPASWGYSPGLGGDGTEKENYWYSLFARSSNKQLLRIGNFLERYAELLKAKGRDY